MVRIVSLGAGVQSSAMLLMALDGRFGDTPDCAVFADTQWEPQSVYDWLDQLEQIVAPFPIHRVTKGDGLKNAALRAAVGQTGRFESLPYYLEGPNGEKGMGRRHCTSAYKLGPLHKFFRSVGASAKNPVESWIGISTDEAHRMKPARVKYATNRYPLIEANLSRYDCEVYLKGRGFTPIKSACLGCPYKSDASWAKMRKESPEEFASVVEFDERIRVARGLRSRQFVHRSLTPLGQVKEFKHENQSRMFFDEFGNECEGMCGL